MVSHRTTRTVADPQGVLRSDAMMMRLLDKVPVGMLLAQRSGDVVYANRALAEMLGQGEGATLCANIYDLAHPDDDTALSLQLARLARGEVQSCRGEHRLRHADGHPIWVVAAATVWDGEAGDPDLIIIQLTNIEVQKRAEEALVYSEKRWKYALESGRQGVWDYDYRTDTIFYSDAWRQMRGYQPDEWVDGATAAWHSRIHPDDLPTVKANIDRQAQSDDTFQGLEYRERRKDGSYVWILSRGRAVEWDETGFPLRTIGTDTDITHLKEVELELAAEKERLRIILASVADGMISTDADSRVEFMNAAAEQLTGINAAEAKGRPVDQIFRLRDHTSGAVMDCPVSLCFEQQQPVRVEDDAVLVALDGAERDIRCTAAPVMGNNGKIVGAVLVFQDVSQSRALQRQLAHTASHDALTGVMNRAAFEHALTRAEREAQMSGKTSVLIYIDLDHFKPVNDTAGHAAGDELLRQVAQTIRDSCRAHDAVARIGGDEFAVILEGCPPAVGKTIADKICRAIAALEFVWAGRSYRIGGSAGVTTINGSPSALGFMGEADAACYAAKADGRGRAVSYLQMLAGRYP